MTSICYFKTHFDKVVNFFRKKITTKGGDFKNGELHSDFMFVNIEPYISKTCDPYQNIATLTPVLI